MYLIQWHAPIRRHSAHMGIDIKGVQSREETCQWNKSVEERRREIPQFLDF